MLVFMAACWAGKNRGTCEAIPLPITYCTKTDDDSTYDFQTIPQRKRCAGRVRVGVVKELARFASSW